MGGATSSCLKECGWVDGSIHPSIYPYIPWERGMGQAEERGPEIESILHNACSWGGWVGVTTRHLCSLWPRV